MNDPTPSAPHRKKKPDVPPAGSEAHLLQFVLDSMGDGATIIDEHARFVLRNRAAEHIAGIAPHHASPAEWSRELGVCLPDGVALFPEDDLPIMRALRGELTPETLVVLNVAGRGDKDIEIVLAHDPSPDPSHTP